MKLVIDIDEKLLNSLKFGDIPLSKSPGTAKILKCVENGTPINHRTNGEVIKTVFPEAKITYHEADDLVDAYYRVDIKGCDVGQDYPAYWWDSTYEEGTSVGRYDEYEAKSEEWADVLINGYPEERVAVLVACPEERNIYTAYRVKGLWYYFIEGETVRLSEEIEAWRPIPQYEWGSMDRRRAELHSEDDVVKCKDCKYRIENHYESEGEAPYVKLTCGNQWGLKSEYQIHEDDFCSRAERRNENA